MGAGSERLTLLEPRERSERSGCVQRLGFFIHFNIISMS